MFIEGTADCVCVCVCVCVHVWTMEPYYSLAWADRQEVNCDWWNRGSKQEAFPCELPAPVFPCQHTHTHTHTYIQVTTVFPCHPALFTHIHIYIHNYGKTHFLSLIISCCSQRNRSWSFPCQPCWQGGHTHIHGHRHARTHPNALKRPECQSPCRRMEVEQNSIE